MKIVVFGKGAVGGGLGLLMAGKGHDVSYADARRGIEGAEVKDADMVLLAIPFQGVGTLAASVKGDSPLTGKILMDATNPVKGDWSPETDFGISDEEVKSAGEAVQRFFPDSRVVKVFNTVFADNFKTERLTVGGSKISTFVAGNDPEARGSVVELAKELGFEPVETGELFTARYLEAMAHLNIQLAVKMGRGTDTGFLYFDRNN
jgi:8-hydroxy-5-deazaflavin:NADPH oxidoreductase